MKRPLLSLTALLICAACGSESSSSSTQSAAPQANQAFPQATIGVSMNDVESKNDFLKTTYQGFRDAVQANPQVKMLIDTPHGQQENQEVQVRKFLADGAQALVINIIDPSNPATATMVQKLCADKVPVVYFNRNPGEKLLANCDKNAYLITGDDTESAIQQALQVLSYWDAHPEVDKNKDGIIQYAMIKTHKDVVLTQERSKWLSSTLENYPQRGKPTQLLFADHANFSTTQAEEIVSKWIQEPNFAHVELIVGNTDDVALGAVNALKKKNIKLPVFGIDGTLPALKAIKSGDLTGTTSGHYDVQAQTALRMASNLANKRPVTEGVPTEYHLQNQTIKSPFTAIDSSNIDQYLK